MRYNEILSEKPRDFEQKQNGFIDTDEKSFESVWSHIEKDCSQILEIYKANAEVFYRGMKRPGGLYHDRPREDRKPVDTDEDNHYFTDMGLKFLGFATNRSNHVAVTSNNGMAQRYGNVFVVFPKDGFKFLYSKMVSDWINIADFAIQGFLRFLWKNPENQQKLKDMNGEHFHDENFLTIRHEMEHLEMLEMIKVFRPEFEQYWKEVSKTNGLDDKDIMGALKSGHEVMISGSSFYAINFNRYRKLMEQKLHFNLGA